MKLLGLILLIVAASCDGTPVNNNKWLDEVLERANKDIRETASTMLPLPSGQLNGKVSYSDGIVLGLDSFYRTADATTSYNGTHFLSDIHYGFRFLSAAFKNVNIGGKDMSATFRVRDNSIHFAFYLIRINGCKVRLVNMEVERLSKVDFGSSSQEYDGSDVEEFFGTEVLSTLNAYLNSHKEEIEESLQFLCHPHEKNLHPEPRYLEFVEDFFFKRDN
ncbi:uncharacterized protein [Halyomorpha halys]|uniref:uncharacterized protein n=1 Tax=Halyomorpha halys TaxID=286706 RepID=UPI0006D505C4|nr:uncharacterized protein LOC106687672 [Halyomorpha halys]